jgi:hypothetical protein
MAGKAKSYYVTVFEIVNGKHKTLVSKMFMDVTSANTFKKEMEAKYPAPGHTVMREYY